MKGRWESLAMAAAAAAAVGVSTPVAAQDDVVEWRQDMRSGQLLEIRNVTGDVHVTLARGTTAEVVAEKRGREGDFHRIDVLIEENRDGYTICAVYDQPGRDGCDWDHDSDGDRDRGDDNLRASLHFMVRLPAGVELDGATVTGDVVVRGVESDVTARTVTGEVEVRTTGIARASNVSGSIDVEMGSTDWRDLSFNTVSGDITVRLPSGIDTDVEFESLSGDLDSDFDLGRDREQSRWRFVGARVNGTIGSGGRSLSLKTVSGDARLLRAGS